MTSNCVSGVNGAGVVVQAGEVYGGVHVSRSASQPWETRPQQLPPDPPVWCDRENELARLDSWAAEFAPDGHALLVLTGPGGIGKTQLAARWLRGRSLPGGQLFADLGGSGGALEPEVVLRHWLVALGVEHAGHEVQGLWRTVTASRPKLGLLVDNARSTHQVRALLPAGGAHTVVVTARRALPALAGHGARFLRVPPLPRDGSQALLRHLLGTERVHADLDAAEALASACGHRPLPLCIAAARLAARPGASLQLAHGGLMESLDETYAELTVDEARCYRVLGLLPVVDVDLDAVATAGALPADVAERALEALVDLRLAEPVRRGGRLTVRLHDDVRRHAAALARDDTADMQQEVLRRWMGWLLATATSAERQLAPWHRRLPRDLVYLPNPAPFHDHGAALDWLQDHEAALRAAILLAEERRWDRTVWQLVHAMWPHFHRRKPLELGVDLHQRGLAAARRCGDRLAEREMLTSLGVMLRGLRRHTEAREGAALALESARLDDDPRGMAQALNQLGNIHLEQGELGLARPLLEESLRLREALRERHADDAELYSRQAGLTRVLLGWLALDEGRDADAIEQLGQAHSALAGVGDRLDAARALAFLASAHGRSPDQLPRSWALFDRAEAQFAEAGAVLWHARVAEFRGDVARRHERWGDARAAYTEAVRRFTTVPDSLSTDDAHRIAALLDQLPSVGDE
ncbi:tetratricopeptide repeat protein [Streptomyces sulphureus]|uniref:tetratricopeptide repeat protein n=1 Tax=Streptomyces sulphureus TaxID=47758 RepID=UPI0003A21961|nr:tetratricopeptide repeat protein [Streptomyces sulphureus]